MSCVVCKCFDCDREFDREAATKIESERDNLLEERNDALARIDEIEGKAEELVFAYHDPELRHPEYVGGACEHVRRGHRIIEWVEKLALGRSDDED